MDNDARPDSVGRFQIVRQLGSGGMGTVFEGHDAAVNRYVAVKLLHRHLLEVPSMTETFVSEARRIAKLEAHEHIPTVYEVGEHDGLPFIAMRKIDGHCLQEILQQRGVLSVDELRSVCSGVGSALAFAHARGIVHCDVKPQNVLIDASGKAFLTDFGISRARKDPLGSEVPAMLGCTPCYASPEQLRGQDPDDKSDIYSLGVMLYEMCTGTTPFAHCSTEELRTQILSERPCSPVDINPRVPVALSAALDRALAKAPSSRPQRVIELVREVLSATDAMSRLSQLQASGDTEDGIAARSPSRSTRTHGSKWLVPALAAVALGGFWIVGNDATRDGEQHVEAAPAAVVLDQDESDTLQDDTPDAAEASIERPNKALEHLLTAEELEEAFARQRDERADRDARLDRREAEGAAIFLTQQRLLERRLRRRNVVDEGPRDEPERAETRSVNKARALLDKTPKLRLRKRERRR